MFGIIINVFLSIIALLLGGYILFFGRRAIGATLGIVTMAVTANLLAVFIAGVQAGWDLVEIRAWGLLGVALIAAIIGVVLGRYRTEIAVKALGFIAGANIALWLFDVGETIVKWSTQLPEQAYIWIGLGLVVGGGFIGLWLVRRDRDEALILLSVLVGTELINDALHLSETWSLTAVILLSLALAGVLAQYADYLREQKAGIALGDFDPLRSSIA